MPASKTISSPSPTPGRRERKAAETRERIFHAAIELFAQRGLHNVTVEQITERADVGKGTFFNYFAGKEEVLAYFGASQVERLTEAAARGELRGSARERILQIIRILSCHPALTQDLSRALLVAYLHLGTDAEQYCPTVWQVTDILAEIIRTAQAEGVFTRERSPEDTALFVLGQFFLAQLTWCTGYSPGPLAETAGRFAAMAVDTLSVRSAEAAAA
jgi:AcrR family transcriptional regulator